MLSDLLKQAGFEVTEQKEEQLQEREKTELELLQEDAQDGELLSEEELIKLGFKTGSIFAGITSVRKNGVEIFFYGDSLSFIEIDGTNIEEMEELKIPKCTGPDDNLCTRIGIGSDAILYVYRMAGII